MAKDASIYVFHADTEGLNFRKAFSDAGFYLSGVCIWAKQSLVFGRSPYQWKHEPILFGWRKDGRHRWYSDRKQTTVIEFDKPSRNGEHPTMKPVSLSSYQIQNSSKKNDPCSWVETGTSFSILPRDLKNIMLNKAYQGQISKVNTCPIEAIYTGKNGEKGKLNSSELLNGEFGPTTKPFSKVTIRPQD